jgi:hypothetical protein
MRRLHALGIRPRMARSTALVEPASELPAVVVSRLLGIHQTTADTWKRIGGQDTPTPPRSFNAADDRVRSRGRRSEVRTNRERTAGAFARGCGHALADGW